MLRIRKILHPTDFSESAMQSLELARSLARDHAAKLILVTVVTPVVPVTEFVVPEEITERQVEEMTRRLTRVQSTINDVPVEHQVVVGIPGRAIVNVANDLNVDLIVMGTEGRSGITRLLMGSVAEYVIRHAACPVLAVKRRTKVGNPVDEDVCANVPVSGSMSVERRSRASV